MSGDILNVKRPVLSNRVNAYFWKVLKMMSTSQIIIVSGSYHITATAI